jgi:hypothetical protein
MTRVLADKNYHILYIDICSTYIPPTAIFSFMISSYHLYLL